MVIEFDNWVFFKYSVDWGEFISYCLKCIDMWIF